MESHSASGAELIDRAAAVLTKRQFKRCLKDEKRFYP